MSAQPVDKEALRRVIEEHKAIEAEMTAESGPPTLQEVRARIEARRAERLEADAKTKPEPMSIAQQNVVASPATSQRLRRPTKLFVVVALALAVLISAGVFWVSVSTPAPGDVYEDQFGLDNDNLRRCAVVEVTDAGVRLSCWIDRDGTAQEVQPLDAFRRRFRRIET